MKKAQPLTKYAHEEANAYIREFLAPKFYEPPSSSVGKLMDVGFWDQPTNTTNPHYSLQVQPLKNVSLVLVYPQVSTKFYNHIIRPHDSLFRNLPRIAGCVEKVELSLPDVDLPVSVEECVWRCIRLVKRRVSEIVARRPHDHIFLAGWGTSCLINHRVLMSTTGVSGLIDFAFPSESAAGPRGRQY